MNLHRPSPAVAFRTDANEREWLCNVAGGVEITLSVRDSNNAMAYSDPIIVRKSMISGLISEVLTSCWRSPV